MMWKTHFWSLCIMAAARRQALHIHGSIPALVTPFAKGKVDFSAFEKLVEWHIAEGSHGLVPCGTTGETPTLSVEEHLAVVRACVKAAKGRVPVIAGAGSNSTDKAIMLAKDAEKNGADAILLVSPYYNKPTQEGLFQHFKAVHDAVGLPIILYNVPGRTGVEISVETVARAGKLPRIIGIKDASVDLSRPLAIRRLLGPDFIQLSGEDATVAAYLAQGGHGCISVTANVAPKLCADLHDAWAANDMIRFGILRDRLLPLHKTLFIETSPAPAKYCLSKLGMLREDLRLPLVPVTAASRKALDAAMRTVGVAPAKKVRKKAA